MKLSPEVIEVLDDAKCDGNLLYLAGSPSHKPETPRLNPKLYQAVNKALILLGGKWKSGKVQAHVFDGPPQDAISDAIAAGSIEDRNKTLQFFETPKSVAQRLVAMADIRNNQMILEPSAGNGAILKWLPCTTSVFYCEIDLSRHTSIRSLYPPLNPLGTDFLAVHPDRGFHRIVMNPPFSKQQDIAHVLHAHKFLKSSGILVSVMASGVTYRNDRRSSEFREFVDSHGGSIEMLPEGSFKESGTLVSTCVARIPA